MLTIRVRRGVDIFRPRYQSRTPYYPSPLATETRVASGGRRPTVKTRQYYSRTDDNARTDGRSINLTDERIST